MRRSTTSSSGTATPTARHRDPPCRRPRRGLPVTVPGMQVDRRCGSGLQAVVQACLQVASGDDDLVVAGGAESMSNVAFLSTDMRWGGARHGVNRARRLARGPHHRGGRVLPGARRHARDSRETCAANTASPPGPRRTGRRLTPACGGRAEQREYSPRRSLPSRCRPVRGESSSTRRHPRADTTVESLAKAQTCSGQTGSGCHRDGGNYSGQNDAASVCWSPRRRRPPSSG